MQLAVLDTNILVSALLTPGGPPGQVLAAVKAGQLTPVFNPTVFAEYKRVLQQPRLALDPLRVDAALEALRVIGERLPANEPPPPPGLPALPDPSDWPFIACALAANCPVITGNAKHFPAGLGVKVMTPREWVDGGGFSRQR